MFAQRTSDSAPAAAAFEGIRVLDLSRVLSGPFASMMLADLGADVWKVEPRSGDPSRELAPPYLGNEAAYFVAVNRNKRSLCLDYRHPQARAVLRRLAAHADVVLENFLPGVKRDLGLAYEEVAAGNPRVVYCSISGFGQTGPYADRPALDNIFQGMSGLMAISGEGAAPVKAGERIGDIVAGLNAAYAIAAALHARERRGRGQYIELSLLDCLIAAQAPSISWYFATGEQPPRAGNGSPFSAPTGTFATADRPVNICIMTDKHWRSLCRVLGREGLAQEPRYARNADRLAAADELHQLVAGVLLQESADVWLARFADAGIPAGPIYSYPDVFADPQVRHNGMLRGLEHPSAGHHGVVGFPVRYADTPARLARPAPRLGEHSREILDQAGFASEEIQRLVAQGAVIAPDTASATA